MKYLAEDHTISQYRCAGPFIALKSFQHGHYTNALLNRLKYDNPTGANFIRWQYVFRPLQVLSREVRVTSFCSS